MKSHDDKKQIRAQVHVAVIVISTVYVLALLSQNVRFYDLNRELLALEREKTRVEEEKERNILQYEHYRNPLRIRRVAGTELGMTLPGVEQIRDLEKER